MLNQKMKAVIDEINGEVTEREELIHTIALALLTRKNLFVLGDVGQAKSYGIDLFRKHISDARQFEILMSKECNQQELFGRLDLASIIPGNISKSRLMKDSCYKKMYDALESLLASYHSNLSDTNLRVQMNELRQNIEDYRKALAELYGGIPEIITDKKIPDSHICFLDEIFKSNEGILNSLLKALNERKYTNEGVVTDIPVISFFSASNEIPNFNNPEEKILKALYDRFDFKVKTEYVKEKSNRLKTLKNKQNTASSPACFNTITLDELFAMQQEVRSVSIPDSINELMDTILCELRKKEIAVSDRTYFNFGIIVQAEAWLKGNDKVTPADMSVLVNYLWSKPEERAVIHDVIARLSENPLKDQIDRILADAYACRDMFNSEQDKNKALISLKSGLIQTYDKALALNNGISDDDAALSSIDGLIATLDGLSRDAYSQTRFTYIPLAEQKAYQNLNV